MWFNFICSFFLVKVLSCFFLSMVLSSDLLLLVAIIGQLQVIDVYVFYVPLNLMSELIAGENK